MSAAITADGLYRYELRRDFEPGLENILGIKPKPLVFCMLNPSKADAEIDDPTITRCIGFAKRERASGLVVVNVYAFRATDPKKMLKAKDPVGEVNLQYIEVAAAEAGRVVCAWGTNARDNDVGRALAAIWKSGAKTFCLGQTKAGHPRHPLYVRGDQPLLPF